MKNSLQIFIIGIVVGTCYVLITNYGAVVSQLSKSGVEIVGWLIGVGLWNYTPGLLSLWFAVEHKTYVNWNKYSAINVVTPLVIFYLIFGTLQIRPLLPIIAIVGLTNAFILVKICGFRVSKPETVIDLTEIEAEELK